MLFFYKALHGDIDLDVKNFVNFLSHGCTRLSQKTTLLKVPLCRTTTFQSSYFNHIVKLWNCACNVINISTFSSLDNFQIFLKTNYFNLLNSIFDTDLICTWSSVRRLPMPQVINIFMEPSYLHLFITFKLSGRVPCMGPCVPFVPLPFGNLASFFFCPFRTLPI